MTLRGNRDFADAIELRVLRWGDSPGLSSGPNVITEVLKEEGGLAGVGDWGLMLLHRQLRRRRKGPGAKECRWPPEAGRGKETAFPLGPPLW